VHRKRSQVAVVDSAGVVLKNRNVVNGVEPVLSLIGKYPTHTPVAFEAAYGWGWLVELLDHYGYEPHLVHPTRCKAIASARLKNDKVDAATLAQLLRADLLPKAWIAPPPVRQLRALLPAPCAAGAAAQPDPCRPGRSWSGPPGGDVERPGTGLAGRARVAGGVPRGDR
jgi:transposase